MLLKFLFFFISTLHAFEDDSPKKLIEISLSSPGHSERFVLEVRGGREFLMVNSNRLTPKRLEVGTYSRPKSSLERTLSTMAKTIPSSKKQDSPHAWRVAILGKPVPLNNPRHALIMDMFLEIAGARGWAADEVTTLVRQQSEVTLTHKVGGRTQSEKKLFVQVCNEFHENRMICVLDKGFIFLD